MKLRDLQRQVGPARQQARLGMRCIGTGQLVKRKRQQATVVAVIQFAGADGADGLELGQGRAVLCIKLVRRR